jgi:hypothetical protein
MPVSGANNRKDKHSSALPFFIVSLSASLYLLAEAGLLVFGRSLCVSEGCGLVTRIARFGDLSMVLIGFMALGFLALLSGLNLRRPRGPLDSIINLFLIAALAAEGFFVGYQIFWLPEVCLFCLSVLGLFLILGLLRWVAGWKETAAGFAAFALVLCLAGLVLPPQGTALPSDKKMILFYSEDCRHCSEIKEEIHKNKLEITPMLVKDYTAALKNLGIDSVPTLFVNGKYEKLILTGQEAIRRYLADCQVPEKPIPSGSEAPVTKKRASKESGISGSGLPLSPLSAPNPLFNPSTDEGLCKENQKCD